MKHLSIIALVAAAGLALGCSGAAGELERIDREIASLKEGDAALYAEMSGEISALEQRLLDKLADTKKRLGNDIDAAMQDLYDLITYKMEETQEFLDDELYSRKQQCDATIMGIRSRVDRAKSSLSNAMDQTARYLETAMKAGDSQNMERLSGLMGSIRELEEKSDWVDHNVMTWKSRLDKIQGSGLYGAMDILDGTVKMLADFDLQGEVDFMEDRIKAFAAIKMDELSGEEMRSLKELIQQMEDWVFEADAMASESESTVEDMTSYLDDWQSAASELYDLLDSGASEVLDDFDALCLDLESGADSVDELADMIGSAVDDVMALSVEIDGIYNSTIDLIDEVDTINGLCESEAYDIEGMFEGVVNLSNELTEVGNHWIDRHYYLFE